MTCSGSRGLASSLPDVTAGDRLPDGGSGGGGVGGGGGAGGGGDDGVGRGGGD